MKWIFGCISAWTGDRRLIHPIQKSGRTAGIGVRRFFLYFTGFSRKRFLQAFDRRRKDEVFHRLLQSKMSYREIFHKQAILLAKFLKGEMEDYYPFLAK